MHNIPKCTAKIPRIDHMTKQNANYFTKKSAFYVFKHFFRSLMRAHKYKYVILQRI